MTKQSSPYNGYVIYGLNRNGQYASIGIVTNNGKRQAICSYSNIPAGIIKRLICVEDRKFYSHIGVDFKAMVRAFVANIRQGKIVQGASTITQQLARTQFARQQRTFRRKIREIICALMLEFKYSKQEILALYLNSVYFGKNLYGLRSACLCYFGKEPESISTSEQITLLTLLRGPNYYLRNSDDFLRRRKMLFEVFAGRGLYPKKRLITNKDRKVHMKKNQLDCFKYESITYLKSSIVDESYSIYTPLKLELQHLLTRRISTARIPLSVIVIKEGRAVGVASSHGNNHPFLHRTNVGSTLKPFLYTILRKRGVSSEKTFSSQSTSIADWSVKEAASYETPVLSLKTALIKSNNNVFVNAVMEVGLSDILQDLSQILPDKSALLPSIILWASSRGLSLFELANIYNCYFSSEQDPFITECRQILGEILMSRLNLSVEKGYLKTGTTNNNQERFAIFGTKNITIGFVTEKYQDITQEDYEKDTDYLFVVKKLIDEILMTI